MYATVLRTVWQAGTPVATLSVHDLAGNRIAEHDGAGAVLREYIWLDGRPLAVVEGGQTYWLHWDHILRPVLATDAAGTVVWAARYLPFGGIDQVSVDTGALTQNLRFPGQWFQSETGLHQNWHRDYDPTTGRYLQADPLGLIDGPSVYGYALQSPVRHSDPTGESAAAGAAALCFIPGVGWVSCGVAACVAAVGTVATAIIGAEAIDYFCGGNCWASTREEDEAWCDKWYDADMKACGSAWQSCLMVAAASPNPKVQKDRCDETYGICTANALKEYIQCRADIKK